jgi:hypothetical protein
MAFPSCALQSTPSPAQTRIQSQQVDDNTAHHLPAPLFRSPLFVSGIKNGGQQQRHSTTRKTIGRRRMSRIRFVLQKELIRFRNNHRPSFLSSQKKYLSAITALAIAVASLFGPAVIPANAVSSADIIMPVVSMTRAVSEKPTVPEVVEQSIVQGDGDGESTAVNQLLEGGGTEETQTPSDIASSSAINPGGDVDAWKAQETTSTIASTDTLSTGMSSFKGPGAVAGVAAASGGVLLARKKLRNTNSGDETQQQQQQQHSNESAHMISSTRIPKKTVNTNSLPLNDPIHVQARNQPKAKEEEAELAARYADISDVGERAFQILVDLGMIEINV